jgi:hypothetical protein
MTVVVSCRPSRCNGSSQPKQQSVQAAKTFRRSPYREATRVIRVPESLVPKVKRMLAAAKADVADAAWLE